MTPERWQHVKELFGASLDLQPSARAAFLRERAGDDRELEREVASLLRALDEEADALERPPLDTFDPADGAELVDSLVGSTVGAYRVVREIGHGGMGVVYEAVRADEHFDQRVAIKTIWRGSDSRVIVTRFQQERQILAGLSHPNIARLLDGGVTSNGQPYFVMEYVDGRPIDAWCAERRYSARERAALFRQVCAAVQHAHRNLVVHRDLKPGNILVTSDGVVKLLDFGIAKLLRPDATRAATLTQAGLNPLTTAYASPEQVRGEAITTASDVYTLGVVLYELLVGRPPFAGDEVTPAELQRRISEVVPQRPSVARTAVSSNGREPPRPGARELAGELDDIVMMALRKEPDRRYASAEQLSEDLRRYLEQLPVQARPDTVRYRATKFVARNRAAVVAGAVALIALVAGAAGVAVQGRAAARERDHAREQAAAAERERDRAEQVSRFLQGIVGTANPSWNAPSERIISDTVAFAMLDAVARRADAELASTPDVRGSVLQALGRANRDRGRFDIAVAQLESALALHRAMAGTGHRDVALDLYQLGRAEYQRGDVARGASLLAESRQLYRANGDTLSIEYVGPTNDLGLAHFARGELAAAEPLIREAVRVLERIGRDTNPEYAIALGNLGLAADGLGRLGEADSLYRAALDAFGRVRAAGGRDVFERGWTLHNLALVRVLRGAPEEAAALMTQAHEVFTRFMGERHPIAAISEAGLSRVYHALEQDDRALLHARRAEAILRRTVPPDHPDVARTELAYGQALVGLGRLAEGARRIRHAVAIRRAALTPGDYRTADAEISLGAALVRQGRYADADTLMRRAYEATRSALGERHPKTALAARELVVLYEAWGRPEEAARFAPVAAGAPGAERPPQPSPPR